MQSRSKTAARNQVDLTDRLCIVNLAPKSRRAIGPQDNDVHVSLPLFIFSFARLKLLSPIGIISSFCEIEAWHRLFKLFERGLKDA